MTNDIGRRFALNTPIAAVMELVNEITKKPDDPAARFAAETAVSLIQPYASHIAEELSVELGHERLWEEPWPESDRRSSSTTRSCSSSRSTARCAGGVEVGAALAQDELVEAARGLPRVQELMNGKEFRKAIVVPGKLVNLVV